MHPQQLGVLASQRVAEHRAAVAELRIAAAARGRRRPIRSRAGWALIQLGLRLVLQPAES
jgi:hypothetical protein